MNHVGVVKVVHGAAQEVECGQLTQDHYGTQPYP